MARQFILVTHLEPLSERIIGIYSSETKAIDAALWQYSEWNRGIYKDWVENVYFGDFQFRTITVNKYDRDKLHHPK